MLWTLKSFVVYLGKLEVPIVSYYLSFFFDVDFARDVVAYIHMILPECYAVIRIQVGGEEGISLDLI